MSLLTAVILAIGLSTVTGSLLGVVFRKIPHRYNDMILGGASGLMLGAAVQGLIVPATLMPGTFSFFLAVAGIFAGAALTSLIERVSPHLHALAGIAPGSSASGAGKVLIFVAAIAIHKFPEGLAAGVSFGTGSAGDAASVAFGLSLQNVPEAVVITSPLLAVGISLRRTLLVSGAIGLVGMAGVILGYGLIALPAMHSLIPFLLSFAGGAMLFVIGKEMIPETHSHGYEKAATFALLGGLILFLAVQRFFAA